MDTAKKVKLAAASLAIVLIIAAALASFHEDQAMPQAGGDQDGIAGPLSADSRTPGSDEGGTLLFAQSGRELVGPAVQPLPTNQMDTNPVPR